MFGRRCTLCGGKLNSHGVCKECGLDNNKNDRNYRVNKSDCDHQPLTHVHEDKYRTEPVRQTRPMQPRNPVQNPEPRRGKRKDAVRQTKDARGKRKRGCMIALIVIILVIAVFTTFGGVISGVIRNLRNGDGLSYEGYGSTEDPYANVTREIPKEGETHEYQLDSGTYIVGVHIPEGVYHADTDDDFDVVSVHDYDEGIYLYEYKGKTGGNYLDDLRLYQGAEVEIDTMTPVTLSTSNAQTDLMAGEDNPLTETYVLSGEQTAGENFEPGVYDLEVDDGVAEITVEIVYPDGEYQGELYQEKTLYMGPESSTGRIYRNLVLPEGAVFRCEDDVTVSLTPSEVIESSDYFSYYENH